MTQLLLSPGVSVVRDPSRSVREAEVKSGH